MQTIRAIASLVLAVLLALALAPAAASARGAKPLLEITKITYTTHGGRTVKVAPGASVESCESDPVFGLSFFYRWAHMKEPGKEELVLDAPGSKEDTNARDSLLESSGNNAMTINADEFLADSTALPSGGYHFEVKLDNVAKKASVSLQASSC